MNNKKIKVGILFGGKSAEHDVSLQSAKNVIAAIDKDLYEVILIGIDKTGKWLLLDQTKPFCNTDDSNLLTLNTEGAEGVALVPGYGGKLTFLANPDLDITVDVVFPVLHGPFGEDGTVQGLLKLAGVPFVGASVVGSAVGMDKDVMKRLLRDAGIPIAKFLAFSDIDEIDFEEVVSKLGLPCFVKPANMGSSVGVSKVKDKESFTSAISEAFEYDTKILIEEYVEGRELECAVLGNQDPQTSGVGEIISLKDFYSYDAKYIDADGAKTVVTADISEETKKQVREMAVKAFKALNCEGMGRVDFFLKKDGRVLVNEINTIPGFTKISMYPQLWVAAEVSYPALVHRLIELALERFTKEQRLK